MERHKHDDCFRHCIFVVSEHTCRANGSRMIRYKAQVHQNGMLRILMARTRRGAKHVERNEYSSRSNAGSSARILHLTDHLTDSQRPHLRRRYRVHSHHRATACLPPWASPTRAFHTSDPVPPQACPGCHPGCCSHQNIHVGGNRQRGRSRKSRSREPPECCGSPNWKESAGTRVGSGRVCIRCCLKIHGVPDSRIH